MSQKIEEQDSVDIPPEEIKKIQQQCQENLGAKLSKKDAIEIMHLAKEADEWHKLCDTAVTSWTSLSTGAIAEFRVIYQEHYGDAQKFSDHEINEIAHRLSVLGTMQAYNKAGADIRAIMIKRKPVVIAQEDVDKLRKLFSLAFTLELTHKQLDRLAILSYWFVWYEKGFSHSLPEALDQLLIHYDKKKRGKKGSLKTDHYDLGYFYRWIAYQTKERPTKRSEEVKPLKLNSFLQWVHTDFPHIRSWLSGTTYTKNEEGNVVVTAKLDDWD